MLKVSAALAIFLTLFFGYGRGLHLVCHYCMASSTNCTNVKEVNCTQTIANETRAILSQFQTVPTFVNEDFLCIHFNYTVIGNSGEKHRTLMKSCVYDHMDACAPRARSVVFDASSSCSVCQTDLCNKNAGTSISTSLRSSLFGIACGSITMTIAIAIRVFT